MREIKFRGWEIGPECMIEDIILGLLMVIIVAMWKLSVIFTLSKTKENTMSPLKKGSSKKVVSKNILRSSTFGKVKPACLPTDRAGKRRDMVAKKAKKKK
jgi:hypothetical protein